MLCGRFFACLHRGLGRRSHRFWTIIWQYKTVIGQMGGVVAIMFGLATLDIIRVPSFYSDSRQELAAKQQRSPALR